MYVMNAEIYAAKTNRNWSDNERELNSYLAREYRYQTTGARSSYKFCTESLNQSQANRMSPEETESGAWPGASLLTAILVALRLRRPDRAGE